MKKEETRRPGSAYKRSGDTPRRSSRPGDRAGASGSERRRSEPSAGAGRVSSERVRLSEVNTRSSATRIHRGAVSDFPSERREKSKKKGVKGINILSLCFFCLFLAYLAFYFIQVVTTDKPSTVQVVYGSIDIPVVHKGVIIRSETTYSAPRAGTLTYRINNKAKVKKGTAVCDVYDEKTVKEISSKLESVNKSILSMQESRSEYSLYESDIRSANAIIKKEIDNSLSRLANFDASALYVLKEKVGQTLEVRNGLLLSENRGSLVGFSQEKSRYEDQMKDAVSTVYAAEGGVLSYKTDGLESTLTASDRNTLSKEMTTSFVDYDKILYPKEVKDGANAFKIVTSNEWYIVAYLPSEAAKGLKENREATLYLVSGDGYTPLEMTVEKISSYEKESYVVFKSTKLMADYLDMRSVEFKINLDVTQGFKIPTTAITERMMLKIPKQFVFKAMVHEIGYEVDCVYRKGIESNVLTEIAAVNQDDEFVYVLQELETLKLGDTVVSNSDPAVTAVIQDFDNVKGVYVLNGSIPLFKKITIGENSSSETGYTVIDPALNTGIKIDDTLVLDAKTIVN